MYKYIRQSSTKILLLYVVIFSLSVSVLSFFLYYSTVNYVIEQTDSVIDAEINGLSEQYSKSGVKELATIINRRIELSPSSPSVYLLVDHNYQPISGNLTAWPNYKKLGQQWVSFTVLDHQENEQPIKGKVFNLLGNYRLIVGRNVSTQQQLQSLIFDALSWFVLLTVSLGIIGGIVHSKSVLNKVTKINQACEHITSGDLTGRIERDNSNDEFDQLAKVFNNVLDSNYQLMLDVKRVSDNIAHDLKTPLSRLKNSLEEALIFHRHEDINHKLEQSIEEADTLLGMFNSLLQIVSIEKNADINLGKVTLNTLLEDVYELYLPIAESKKIYLHLELYVNNVVVNSNGDLLFQALINVLDNAIKYTPEHGEVIIELSEEGSVIHVIINDTGIGVPDNELSKITTRFYRADQSRHQPGTGLGLSLVNAISSALNIKLGFKNNRTGLSVQFSFNDALSNPRGINVK